VALILCHIIRCLRWWRHRASGNPARITTLVACRHGRDATNGEWESTATARTIRGNG
jgi:hypothetical protein